MLSRLIYICLFKGIIYLFIRYLIMEDLSLSDWVAVKSDIFSKSYENDISSSKFICGWNNESSKLAITLHEGSRTANDENSKNKACLLSIKELYCIHKQLCLVNPSLESAFPSCIRSKTKTPSKNKIEDICIGVGYYLTEAINLVGKQIVLSSVFGDEDPLNRYEEDIQEFKLKTLEKVIEKNFEELDEILQLRDRAESLLQMKSIHMLEDEVCDKIFDSISELYNFRLQPFLELREIAHSRIEEAKAKLKENVGPNIKEKAEKDFEKWTEESLIASEALQQMYLEYYRRTLNLVEGIFSSYIIKIKD